MSLGCRLSASATTPVPPQRGSDAILFQRIGQAVLGVIPGIEGAADCGPVPHPYYRSEALTLLFQRTGQAVLNAIPGIEGAAD